MDDLVQTPYGYVRIRTLQTLQSTFGTTELLKAVDDLDRFYAQWKRELRDDVLRVHAIAHSVINDAPLSCAPGEEGLGEIAASVRRTTRVPQYLHIGRLVVEATCDSQARLGAPVARVSRSRRSKVENVKKA